MIKVSLVEVLDDISYGFVVVDFVEGNDSERLYYQLLLRFQLYDVFDCDVGEGGEDHQSLEGDHQEHHQRPTVQVRQQFTIVVHQDLERCLTHFSLLHYRFGSLAGNSLTHRISKISYHCFKPANSGSPNPCYSISVTMKGKNLMSIFRFTMLDKYPNRIYFHLSTQTDKYLYLNTLSSPQSYSHLSIYLLFT